MFDKFKVIKGTINKEEKIINYQATLKKKQLKL